MISQAPPVNEAQLIEKVNSLQGLSIGQLASNLNINIPTAPQHKKGWLGKQLEIVLGATANNLSEPDFRCLGVELKTLPINKNGYPAESTFITHIPLLTIHQQSFETSQCYRKLKRVLWVLIEDDEAIPFNERRIGQSILWSPSLEEKQVLQNDWLEFVFLISTGQLNQIDGKMGDYLQVRPKASHGRALCYGFDEQGQKVLTYLVAFICAPLLRKDY